uniref:Putative amidase domain-containing protein n=1 Tax=candidate division WOR-3 bacterium TaxID=2052148 RepID=A0A7C6AAC8_UNCW3
MRYARFLLFFLAFIPTYLLGTDYNADAARNYAKNWYGPGRKRNPDYEDYTGNRGDCANFVAQCLRAGGFRFKGKRYSKNEWPPSGCTRPKYWVDKKGLCLMLEIFVIS